jgi:hypothetical protein
MYLNSAGIIILIIYQVSIRNRLAKLNLHLDENNVTPWDFALLARNLPKDLTRQELKEKFEHQFKHDNVKVQHINYCFDIQEMLQLTKDLKI